MTTALVSTGVIVALALAAIRRTLRSGVSEGWHRLPPVLPMLAFPTLLGLRTFNDIAVGAAIWVLVLGMILAPTHLPGSKWRPWHLAAVLIAYLVPALVAPSRRQLFLGIGAIALMYLVARKRPLAAIVPSLVDGIGIYLIANVTAHALGVQAANEAGRVTGLDSSLGGDRTFYPLATSLSTPPLMAAIFVAAFVVSLHGSGWRLALRTVALGCGVAIMIGANTRAALIVGVVVALVTFLAPRTLSRIAVPASAGVLSMAFIYPYIVDPIVRPVVQAVVTNIPILSRGNEAADVTFAGRQLIWQFASQFWTEHVSLSTALFGWGTQGTRTSGASSVYGPRFPGLSQDPLNLSVHNSLFQQLYDGGFVGLIALVLVSLLTLRAMCNGSRRGSSLHVMGMAAVTAALWGGGTEVTVAPGPSNGPMWMLFAIAFAVARRPAAEAPASPASLNQAETSSSHMEGLAERTQLG